MSKRDFDVLVIGGGSAGLTASGMAASLGARTALIEASLLGGDCTWTGCVPSKALIKAARVAHEMRTAERYGLPPSDQPIDFAKVMAQMREVRERIYQEADSPEVIASRGVELISGSATFLDAHTMQVHVANELEPRTISSRYIVICAGASAVVPELPDVNAEDILTNESLFNLNERPERILVLGGGPIGIEMGQTLARLGSKVTIVEKDERLLTQSEPECSAILQRALEAEGIQVLLNSTLDSATLGESGYDVQVASGDQWQTVPCDSVLVAVGRRPNIDGLGLEKAGVEYDESGIAVNHSCQTNVDHIYACGDIAKGVNFTHVAENMAKTAITRILLKIPASYERESVPTVTFSDPESASLGKTVSQLQAKGERFRTIRFPFKKIDRGLIEGHEEGVILIHSSLITGRILGAHIVGPNAGEMINELAVAMKNSLTLRDISQTVHAYPTWSLGVRRAADQWYVQQGSPGLLKLLGSVFHFRGEVSTDIGTDNVV